jgi:hypothetical protein
MKKSLSAIVFTSLLGTAYCAQASIVYQSDDRYIYHSKAASTVTPASPYADFNGSWWAWEAGAFQNTSLTSTGMSGTGSTYAGSDAMHYGANAKSSFSVTFGVDQLSNYTLNGALNAIFYDSGAYVKLWENGTEIFASAPYATNYWGDGSGNFSQSGQFIAGNTYKLDLYSYAIFSDYHYESWQFNMSTTPVPVPAAVWLLGSGLVGLAGFRRKLKLT